MDPNLSSLRTIFNLFARNKVSHLIANCGGTLNCRYFNDKRMTDANSFAVCPTCGITLSEPMARNIDSFFSKAPPSPIPDVPPFDKKRLENGWIPQKKAPKARNLTDRPLPSTRDWTEEELVFFNLHYYQVRNWSKWETYFCQLTNPTNDAKSIGEWKLGSEEFANGMHLDPSVPPLLCDFGELIFGIGLSTSTESNTDHLAMYLLKHCNPDNKVLFARPQAKMIKVKIGEGSFTSIPDASLIPRPPARDYPTPSVIIVEDKAIGVDRGKFQIAGELLATALRNFEIVPVAQTVFGIRIIGSAVTFYRADFSVAYLTSAMAGTPVGDITIFRIGGGDESNDIGLSLAYPGESRKTALVWACSLAAAAKDIVQAWASGVAPSITTERISKLN